MRVAIVDDHQLFRKGMKSLLEKMDGVGTVEEAGNGREFLDIQKERPSALVFLDLKMPVLDGRSTMKELHKSSPEVKVIFLTMETGEETVLRCMEDGASGFLAKDAHPDEVREAIRSIREKGIYVSARTSSVMMKGLSQWKSGERETGIQLSEKEMLVLEGICHQKTTAEIAEKLFLSPRTVEGYRRALLEKTEAKSSVGLVLFAAKKGWLDNWLNP